MSQTDGRRNESATQVALEDRPPQNGDSASSVTPARIAGVAAYALTFFWACTFFIGIDVSEGFRVALPFDVDSTAIFFVSSAIFFALTSALSDFVQQTLKERGMCIALVIAIVLYEVTAMTTLSALFAGLVAVLLFQQLHALLTPFANMPVYMGSVMLTTAVLLLLLAFLDPLFAFIFVQAMPVIVLLLYVFARRAEKSVEAFVSKEASSERFGFPFSSISTICADGVLLGFSTFAIGLSDISDKPLSIMLFAALAIVGLVFVFDRFTRITEKMLLDTYTVRVAPFLLVMPFAGNMGVAVCALFILLSVVVNISMIITAVTERVRFNQLSPYHAFGKILGFLLCSAFVGRVLCLAGPLFGESVEIKAIVTYGILFLLIVFQSLVFRDNYPVEEGVNLNLSGVEIEESNPDDPWKKALAQIAEEYELSPRQIEVFELLSRGRNCNFIKDEFYISKATAKAHIYTIYKKLDVHSQQELIDMVEHRAWEQRQAAPAISSPEYEQLERHLNI